MCKAVRIGHVFLALCAKPLKFEKCLQARCESAPALHCTRSFNSVCASACALGHVRLDVSQQPGTAIEDTCTRMH
eukprot:1158507-Pelagomonas_calceolata.AAC.6